MPAWHDNATTSAYEMTSSLPLPKQFVIAKDRCGIPAAWRGTAANDLFIYRSPDVPLVSICVGDVLVAWFIGWFSDGLRFFAADETVQIDDVYSLDAMAGRASGRFVLVTPRANDLVVRTDAAGLLPIVVDVQHGIVASSPTALGLVNPLAPSAARKAAVARTDGTTWYPFALTPYAHVERLLPNQHAILPAGAIHTAKRQATLLSPDGRMVTESIFQLTVRHVRAIAGTGPLDAHLTAGYDSRMVLAATMAAQAAVELVSFRLPTAASALDCDTATRLASMVNLRHRVVPAVAAPAAERTDWLRRTGFCVDDAVAGLCTTVRLNDTGRFTLTGSVGEVGRSFYWDADDLDAGRISAGDLLSRLGFRPSRLLMERAEDWLDHFDGPVSVPEILDWAYIDHRLCGWAGPSSVGHLVDKPTISPLNSRDILSRMLSLPHKYRFAGYFARDFIRLGSDKLLSVPFNRAIGFRRFRHVRSEIKALLPKPFISRLKRLSR
jgi:hypothetical protein